MAEQSGFRAWFIGGVVIFFRLIAGATNRRAA